MEYYAGIDVSLERSSVCVADTKGQIVREGKVASEPEALVRRSATDGRTPHHPGYAVSQCIRKRIEEPFGWIKFSAVLRKTRHRGLGRVGWMFTLTAAYNLVRLPKLLAAT